METKQINSKEMVRVCVLILALLGAGTKLAAQKQETAAQGSSDAAPSDTSHTAKLAADEGVSADYQVGPGDVLYVSVWKEPDASGTVVVRPDGKISLSLINDLSVDGKTPAEIQEVVTEKISPFINSPNVTVSVREIHSKKVFVLGQVGHTGSYQIGQPTTVLQILTEAGGLQPFAKQKSIYVLRTQNGQQKKIPFNYKEVVQGKKVDQNIVLQPGDEVVVP
jgi:polysaccharide export outer membrane protein